MKGDLQVVQTGGNTTTLNIGQGPLSMTMKLYEAKAVERKTEIQCLLIGLAELVTDLGTKLEEANKTVENLKQQKAVDGGGIFDLGSIKKNVQPKIPPKQAGMSAINPGSKKRKVAKGVQFD